MIVKALNNDKLPVYGNGENIRDWLHVKDHCTAIDLIIHNGKVGEVYNIGFVSYPELTGSDESSKLNSRRIYLYVNGVICSTTYKTSTDSIY